MITLRDYQIEAVNSIYGYFAKTKGNPVIAMPTGTGKSVVISGFLQSIFKQWPNQKILILTHVKELIRQNYENLLQCWDFAPAGIYSAGLNKRDTRSPIIFAGIASVAKRWAEFGRVDLVMIDEAHLLGPNDNTMYQKFLTGLRSINSELKVIGLTATPFRLGHGHIADGKSLFSDVCFDITTFESFNRLIAEGYLSPLVPRNTKTQLSIEGVHKIGGEFNSTELQIAVDKNEVTYAALKEALEQAHDRQHWLIFSSGISHAEHIKEMMESFGQTCGIVHSRMPPKNRDENITAFRNGNIRMIVNNNILTTGFDSPWIDCIVCLRPTASSGLWVQMLGRGTRPYPGKKNCLALDFAGNTRRLGPINDPLIPNMKGEGGGEAPVKCCPTCDTWNHISVRKCTFCGFDFPIAVKIKAEASSLELIKGEMPKTVEIKVDHITCREYQTGQATYDES
jgi:DNA repair protein RadD